MESAKISEEQTKLEVLSLIELSRDCRDLANDVPQNFRVNAIVASRIILALAKADESTSRLTKVGIGVAAIGLVLTVVGIYVSIQLAYGVL